MEAVLAGRYPDRPPVSFWHHFSPDQLTGQPAVDAHLRHFEEFDLDFIKVMNDHHYPRGKIDVIRSARDLAALQVWPGDAPGFVGQLEVLTKLREHLTDETMMCTTLFNPWAVLRYLSRPPSDAHGPPVLNSFDERDELISRMLQEDRRAVADAVATIGESMANFARECIKAGADGIFLSVRDDWVNRPVNGPDTYEELVRQVDLKILNAASDGRFNMLHVCGRPLNFAAFARYPVHAINWADRAAGPSLAYARDRVKPAIAGGVDNLKTLPKGTPDDVAYEVRDAIRQARHRPIMITAGCTYDPAAVPEANLHAMVNTAKSLTD